MKPFRLEATVTGVRHRPSFIFRTSRRTERSKKPEAVKKETEGGAAEQAYARRCRYISILLHFVCPRQRLLRQSHRRGDPSSRDRGPQGAGREEAGPFLSSSSAILPENRDRADRPGSLAPMARPRRTLYNVLAKLLLEFSPGLDWSVPVATNKLVPVAMRLIPQGKPYVLCASRGNDGA